jgi:hypothetical protein
VDEGGEQERGDHVDGQDVRPGNDAGVVDDRVHRPEAVHLVGDTARLLGVGEVPDDGHGAAVQEVAHGREPVPVASVDDDLVPLLEQRLRGRPSQTVCGAGDEDACRARWPCTHADLFAARGSRRSVVVRVSPLVIGST